jgi:hypothetical protein
VKPWSKSVRSLGIAAALAVAFGACDEQLSGGIACPALCPNPQLALRDTTFFAVDFDTSIAGYPGPVGAELQFYLASLGDTLETAAAIRFDSLPRTWRRLNAAEDSAITHIDTGSHLRLSITTGDTIGLATTIEVYDIDMGGDEDNDPQAVFAAFSSERLLASRTVPADSLRDSVRVPIDPAFILAKLQDTFPVNRLRLGVRLRREGNPKLIVLSSNALDAAQLVFRPSPDTTVPLHRFEPFSRVPIDPFLANDFADYLVVLRGPPPPPPDAFRIGGLPARRAYLRFDIPRSILDSSNVVRATLFLTQRPSLLAPAPTDSVGLGHFGVTAGATITDVTRALFFLQRLSNRDTLYVFPGDSAVRSFEMIDWVRAWRGTDPAKTPRAMALASTKEGENAGQVDFFSIEAGPAERPRLRLTYIPRSAGPLP